jgi:dTDP-4-dehydrorhamnose reductase
VLDVAIESSGVYHACNAGETTWCGFVAAAVQLAQQSWPSENFARIIPITTAEYPTPARRPVNSRLDCSKLAQRFGVRLPMWDESLKRVMNILAQSI